ncbi:MAG: hypothetical protein LBH05_06235 [Deferribacteraceae bacterium]|jgi:hypothetical protein|nr:hypothetical protein [Deferribacteraceae bacterium]
MERIEKFELDGKVFFYYDLSGFETNDDFIKFIEAAQEQIVKCDYNSLHTVTNIEGIRFDSETKEIVAGWMTRNGPYVKYGAIIGIDGIKKMMVNMILTISGRKNITFASTKEQAIEWLLKQK